ncbi:succinylglutamate desuccinylase/aspartoacylase family protein [Ancylothrix sp. C2]|uniref:succinylglutamate desuccinylase/aspartoacylase family protein n=1 Tax=Ancylothrix sp. D3o TaxID=2953691 RepID=UPI0021BB490F|nr:succinylglutamate desuccinylase/aspartoacylase family protein [Ancylothrix sp. D3o]MCT7953003.1 succinylglutamate desuccinylase/aspartoacylase family protein [Ancylothrix sp. D3o]
MEAKFCNLDYGYVGFQKYGSPLITFTSGKTSDPKITITAGIHPDEAVGLFVLSPLIKYLKSLDYIQGTIHIIPGGNSPAHLEAKRVSSLDFQDLNRVAKGNQYGSFTERIGWVLFNFIRQCDFAIQLHDFEMQTPLTGVYMNAGNFEVRRKTLEALHIFSPEMIWAIDTSSTQDFTYQKTIDMALAEEGVPNFPIETTQLPFLTNEEINQTVQGILRVIASLGIIPPLPMSNLTIPPAFTRHEFKSNHAGLWHPYVSLMQPIQEGTKIGKLIVFPSFEEQIIHAGSSGTLIQFRNKQVVHPGMSLFSLGSPAEHFIAKAIEVTKYQ